MKNILVIILLSLIASCSAQPQLVKDYTTGTNLIKDSLMFEKFNFELDKNNYQGYELTENSNIKYGANGYYDLKNGGAFKPNNGSTDVTYTFVPTDKAFYSLRFGYFQNGTLQRKGKIAGFNSGIQFGIWKYYNENGNLLKTVDEDVKFGLWGFTKVLDVLDRDKVIDLKTGRNREAESLHFNFDKEKKLWTVKVFKKRKSTLVDIYWEYLFDGNTGKYTRDWFEKYNLNAADMPGLPPLKNSKTNKYKKT